MKTALTCTLALVLSAGAQAEERIPDNWVDVSVTSHHFSEQKFNQDNFGLGFEQDWDDKLVMAGRYHNSVGGYSRYAMAGYLPLRYKGFDAGLVAGLLDGYPAMRGGKPFPAVAGLVRYTYGHWGVNMLILPPAKGSPLTLGFQLRAGF